MSLDLRSLYENEADVVFSFLSQFGLNPPDLEDTVHDTFVTALSRASTYDQERPVRPWLLGIAFRMAVARVRRRSPDTHEVPDQDDPKQNPEQALEARQRQRLVQHAVAELPEEQGTVLVMHDLQGIGAGEIAQMMGAPLATTYSRLRLARIGFATAVRRLRKAEESV